jgi:hypothetical protein
MPSCEMGKTNNKKNSNSNSKNKLYRDKIKKKKQKGEKTIKPGRPTKFHD